ncbi:MAG: class I SAM-dependent methyltransferase, partial [Burkholderiales bacterium]
GAHVLNCFAYTGGFAIAALAAGARHATSIESSAPAIAQARAHQAANGIADDAADWIEGDVFHVLRDLRNRARQFDLIILDPPKFAPLAAHVERASRAYKDINLLALKLLRVGGHLATFSCSGAIDAALFQKIVAGAALDAGADAAIVARLGAADDHPVALTFPEGDYLKGFLIRRIT